MKTLREGFTLIEIMIVAVLLAIAMGGVYEALMMQEQSYRVSNSVIRGQDALRTSLGILESELREVSTTSPSNGGADIRIAASDSIVLRAPRTVALLCAQHPSEHRFTAVLLGDPLRGSESPPPASDSVFLFVDVDGDSATSSDDIWVPAQVLSAASEENTACSAYFGAGFPQQRLRLSIPTDGVAPFAPLRTFESVTYALREFPRPIGWALARSTDGGPRQYLVGGLAPPPDGLRFTYYDGNGNETTSPSQITRMKISVKLTAEAQRDGAPDSLSTNLYFRNN